MNRCRLISDEVYRGIKCLLHFRIRLLKGLLTRSNLNQLKRQPFDILAIIVHSPPPPPFTIAYYRLLISIVFNCIFNAIFGLFFYWVFWLMGVRRELDYISDASSLMLPLLEILILLILQCIVSVFVANINNYIYIYKPAAVETIGLYCTGLY